MPNAVLHFLLARSVLEEWEAAPLRAPFEPSARTRNAFFHGAIGPDMGFFPGADPLVSRLAHHARTGALCRALIAGAERDDERAFAWGWVTHVLADVAVHPLVNEACGELLEGDRARPVWGAAAGAVHVQVEMGLDAAFLRNHPEIAGIRLVPALDGAGVEFVRRAYRETYDAAPATPVILAAHRRVTVASRALTVLQRCAARAMDRSEGRGALLRRAGAALPLRALAAGMPAGSCARGLFTPVAPPAWLLAEVRDVAAGFADWFAGHHASGLVFLRDHCLDTGEVHGSETPAARAALHDLWSVAGGPRREAAA